MTIANSGFEQTIQGLTILKDTQAVLTYSFDWSQWLPQGDQLATVQYTITARSNDPDPLIKVSEGVQAGDVTFVELSDGQVNKTYTVTCRIVTNDGLVDRRSFRVKVQNRSA